MTLVRIVSSEGDRELELAPRPLGRGGFGTVFRATDRLGAEFALKLVPLADDPAVAAQQREAFARETAALQRVRHPNVVRYMLHGEAPDLAAGGGRGALALVMEYVEGAPLRDRIGPGGLPAREALEYVRQLCRGLDGIHGARPPLVHRDIKPDNLVIGARDGVLRIVDFGLGRDITARLSAESGRAGTPAYMAPEQMLGAPIDARTDLYAASLVAHELLTGTVPMCQPGGMPDVRARAAGWVPGRQGTPCEFEEFFARGLAPAPHLRFPTAEALMRAFEACVGRLPAGARGLGGSSLRSPPREPIIRGARWEDYRDGSIAAIDREIQAVRMDLRSRGADGPVEARKGLREDRAPDWSTYVVRVPEDLLIAEDTPVRATVDGHTVRGHVVGCDPDEGEMRLALYEDVGPEFGRALLAFDATFILERLRERLESSAGQGNTALAVGLTRNTGRVGDAPLAAVVAAEALNEGQRAAVRRALGSTVTYVWGPPGTGKTRTVGHLLASLMADSGRAAALAPTNVAVDTLLLAAVAVRAQAVLEAIEAGKVVRLGETSAELRRERLHLDWAFECTARESFLQVVARLEDLWREYLEVFGRRRGRPAAEPDLLLRGRFLRVRREVARAREQAERHPAVADELTGLAGRVASVGPQVEAVEAAALARATLVATTLSKFHLDSRLEAQVFPSVIVDEVSMALYPALLYAATRAGERIVVAGDFHQLAPVVISKEPVAQRWLRHDIFELAGVNDDTQEVPARPLLNLQYRMHPEISAVVSRLFYSGRLGDADDVLERYRERRARGRPDPTALGLLDTTDPATKSEKLAGGSRTNPVHAKLVADAVAAAVAGGARAMAVVTPYVGQARLIRDAVRRRGVALLEACRISTVHRFQGQEASLVIFDTVDAPDVPVGFLNERSNPDSLRIINVAASRAQRRLLVVAHAEFLGQQLSPRSRLIRLLAELRLRGREFSLAASGMAELRQWLTAAGPASAEPVEPNEWVRWRGHEAVVVSVSNGRVRIWSEGTEVEVPLGEIEAVHREGKWLEANWPARS